MVRLLFLVTLFFVSSFSMAVENGTGDLTLEQIRARLLNKEVVILKPANLPYRSVSELDNWSLVSGDEAAGYKVNTLNHAPSSLIGKVGVVVSITRHASAYDQRNDGKVDAFGKIIDSSKAVNPYIQLIVRPKDSDVELIGKNTYYSILIGNDLLLVDQANSMRNEVEASLHRLIGKKIYNVKSTELLPSDTTVQDLLKSDYRRLYHNTGVANLTPMKVVDAKILEDANAVILKVELPNGDTKILFGSLQNYDDTKYRYTRTFLERIGITAFEKFPPNLSARDISGIKTGIIFRGMSADAVFYTLGLPDRTNNWGSGGEQWVYPENHFIYLKSKVVTDWQNFE